MTDVGREDQLLMATRIWLGMRTLVLEQHDRRADVSAALEMGFIRVKALRAVARGPLTMRALAESLIIDRPYTTVVVDDLERRGFVQRAPDSTDRRLKVVTVTDDGAAAAAAAEAILSQPPESILLLPAGDLAALDHILRGLIESTATRG